MKSSATKRTLSEELKKLLIKKPLRRITVNELITACGISRMTFYYHFRDIYDLAEWTLEDVVGHFINEDCNADNWKQIFEDSLTEMKNNQKLILGVCNSDEWSLVEGYLRKKVHAQFLNILAQETPKHFMIERDRKLAAAFYSYAILGVLVEWINIDMSIPPHEVANTVSDIIRWPSQRELNSSS